MTLPSSSAGFEYRNATCEVLLRIGLSHEQDLVLARQRARQIARTVGYEVQDQVRIATAVSEIAREGLQVGADAAIQFLIDLASSALVIELQCVAEALPQDATARIQNADGIVMARRFLGTFVVAATGESSILTFKKSLPRNGRSASAIAAAIHALLGAIQPSTLDEEFRAQNRELLETLSELRSHQSELAKVNRELEETNRGVVALYAELEDQAESLRRAGEQKVRFYSSISHEFRTPITSVLSLSQFLLDRLDGPLSAEQERQVSLIRKCGQTLLEWVNDLLDLARVDAGRMEIRLSTFPVRDLLASLRGMMRPLVSNTDVELLFDEQGPAASAELTTDEGKLSQILRNLVSNALKFTEHGEVRVEVELASDRPDYVVFSVRDTGIGIAAEDHERIFEEFVQIDGPLQRKRKGTGLGLPLCRRLAGLLGGSLSVASRPGEGSTFRMEIPMRPGQSNVSVAEPARSNRQQDQIVMPRRRLLLIDDDEAWRYLMRQAIAKLPIDLIEAASGVEGLKTAAAVVPDVIILDLLMPVMNGYEVFEILQQLPGIREIPVIICSAEDVDLTIDPRLSGRAHTLIRKPTDGTGPVVTEIEAALRSAGALEGDLGR